MKGEKRSQNGATQPTAEVGGGEEGEIVAGGRAPQGRDPERRRGDAPGRGWRTVGAFRATHKGWRYIPSRRPSRLDFSF